MAYDIPAYEPSVIEAGTSLIFTRTYPDYDPPTGWTLTYQLTSTTEAPITFAATIVDGEFKVDVPYGTTTTWTPGYYQMAGYVNNATERHRVYLGEIRILPINDGIASYEWRTYNRQMLEMIETQLKTGIIDNAISYSINGRSFTAKSNTDLLAAYNYFKAAVAQETNAGKQRRILARFVAPR